MSPSSWSREKKLMEFQSRSEFVRSVGGPAIAVGLVLAMGLWFCGAHGWRSFPVGGSGGFQLKLIAVFVVAGTMVGMVPVAHWTGACFLRWIDRLRDPFAG